MRVSATNVKINLLSVSVIIFLVMFMVACKVKSQSDLFGTYIADYDIAIERLTLNKDGSFIQEVTLKENSKIDISKGRWKYDSKSGYVSFEENFMLVLDGFREFNPDYNHPNPYDVGLPADRYFGRILLGTAEGILYRKVD